MAGKPPVHSPGSKPQAQGPFALGREPKKMGQSFVCVERNQMSTPQEGPPEKALSEDFKKKPKTCQRILQRNGGPVQGWRPYNQPSRDSAAGGDGQQKRSTLAFAAAQGERAAVVFAGFVSLKP